jgi:hypothetical protein
MRRTRWRTGNKEGKASPMPNADGLHPLSRPIATAVTTGVGSTAGAIVGAHVGHPTAGSATTALVAGMVALIGGAETVARLIDPWVRRHLAAPPSPRYQR